MAFPRHVCPVAISLGLLAAAPALRGDSPALELTRGPTADAVTLSGAGSPAGSHRVEHSIGLDEWWPVFATRDVQTWSWQWDDVAESPVSFFRLIDATPPAITAHSSWKSEITLPFDPFLSEPIPGSGEQLDPVEVRWLKFAMIIDGLPEVYFQSSGDYPFHFNFATERLAPFLAMDLDTFNGVSLFRNGQQVVLGAVLWAPGRNELGIQFVGQDEFPREMLSFLYQTVDARITKPDGCVGYYMPTYEQNLAAERDRVYLAGHGIEVSSPERWIGGSVCYAEGWALGRLVYVAAGDIETAYANGTLLPADILLTDGVPAEIPFVAGIVTFEPTTPNSHVAILAQSYGVPFVYLRDPAEQARVLDLAGHDVVVRTGGNVCAVDVFDAEGLDATYRSEIVALKEPLPVGITPIATYGSITMPGLSAAVPEDIGFIGGKAANFGFLRREIPANSPEAIAFTFDLWNAYLDQTVTGGNSLRTEIANRLAGLGWPTDIGALDSTLRGIRDLIKDDADFTAAQKAAIISALSGFDPNRKIRFRSSTNVEDSGVFVGAGLYDSFSGCIVDDTDGDDLGPSHCDPDQPKERGVFRAMRKVYASFYNLNAVVERLRHGIDEFQVGMAILVHHSFPDEIEAANGVATSRFPGGNFLNTTMVSQVGAESVTNPSGGSLPEIVELGGYRPSPNSASLFHKQRSNRLLLGIDTVMTWEDDYQDFGDMYFALADAYKTHFPAIGAFTLEFEYKKLTDDSLVIKQLREVPEAEGRPAPGIALINRPTDLKVDQGESGTVFGNHRLKSLWQIESDSRWIDPSNPGATMITVAELEHAPQGAIVMRTGSPSAWPGATYDTLELHGNTYARDRWQWPSDGGATTYELRIEMPYGTGYLSDPVHTSGDFRIEFWANYETALPGIDWQGNTTVSAEFALLVPGSVDDPLPAGSILKVRNSSNGKGLEINTSFYWPANPTGPTAGYTAPLQQWVGTTISGLTTLPVSLSGYFSQTYRPGHHNFTEEFLFEPGLDPAVPAATLSELQAQDIRMIYLEVSEFSTDVIIKAVGFDGVIRDL